MTDSTLPYTRRKTRAVNIGSVTIGAGSSISIQSMTNTQTRDAAATIEQIKKLTAAGCDIIRVATPNPSDTAALKEIVAESDIPVVADVHFHFKRALEAIEAGVDKIRLNPGNITDREKVKTIIAACKEKSVAIRVGVNAGSIVERRDKSKRQQELNTDPVTLMVDKLREYVEILENEDFYNLVLAIKSPDVPVCIAANRKIAEIFDYPIHLGVTHAGDEYTGLIKSCAAMSALIADGIGDTIRISLAADPVAEVRAASELLCALGLRQRSGAEIIACPTCGRIGIDLPPIVAAVREKLTGKGRGLKVAVMGCVVNGPGEAEEAHIAVCGGNGKGVIYVDGQIVRTVDEEKIADALAEEVDGYELK